MSQQTLIEGQKIVIKRTFDAPVEKVYRAWTDPAQMARWLSPNIRWNAPLVDIDSVSGGRHNITMRHSDGEEMHIVGRYTELVPDERVAFTWIWLEGPMSGQETLVTIELRGLPDGTELTLTHDRQPNATALEGASEGWTGCLDMLESYLAGNPLIGGPVS